MRRGFFAACAGADGRMGRVEVDADVSKHRPCGSQIPAMKLSHDTPKEYYEKAARSRG